MLEPLTGILKYLKQTYYWKKLSGNIEKTLLKNLLIVQLFVLCFLNPFLPTGTGGWGGCTRWNVSIGRHINLIKSNSDIKKLKCKAKYWTDSSEVERLFTK